MALFTALAVAGVAAAATIGSSVLASKAQSKANKKATAASAAAVASTLELQEKIFDQTREDARPWREVGEEALLGIADNVKNGSFNPANFKFEREPGYEFRRDEGEKAIERAAAGRGMVLSGPMLKQLTRFNQGFASNEYQNAYNRNALEKTTGFDQLASLAQIGQVGLRTTAAAGQNFANQGSNAILTGGAQQADLALRQGQNRASMFANINAGVQQGLTNAVAFGGF